MNDFNLHMFQKGNMSNGMHRPSSDSSFHYACTSLPEIIIKDVLDFNNKMSELLVRFDTAPDLYTKRDYLHLIKTLHGVSAYVYDHSALAKEDLDNIENLLSLLLETVSSLEQGLGDELKEYVDNIIGSIRTEISSLASSIGSLSGQVGNNTSTLNTLNQQVSNLLNKQSELESQVDSVGRSVVSTSRNLNMLLQTVDLLYSEHTELSNTKIPSLESDIESVGRHVVSTDRNLNMLKQSVDSVSNLLTELKESTIPSLEGTVQGILNALLETSTRLESLHKQVQGLESGIGSVKKVWDTFEALATYVLDPNESAVPGMFVVVNNDGINNGAYYIESIDRTKNPAEAVITKLSTGKSSLSLAPTVNKDIAHVDNNGQLHIEDMRARWSDGSF